MQKKRIINVLSGNIFDIRYLFTILASIDSVGGVIVNNSQKIELVSMDHFTSNGTIKGFSYPRFCAEGNNGQIFISNGNGFGGDKVYVVNYGSKTISDSILVGKGPERMLKKDNMLYVTNSGSWDLDSTVSVIDLTNKKVVATINVEYRPLDIVEDKNGMIWVFCKGNTVYDESYNIVSQTNSKLVQINPATNAVGIKVDLGSQTTSFGSNIMAISKDKGTIYYENNGIYAVNVTDITAPTTPLITGSFYGVDVDPSTGNIWASNAPFTGNGTMYIYDSTGAKLDEFEVGEYPSMTAFN